MADETSPPRRWVDFHTHSTASDGTFSPEAVIQLAEKQQLAAVALTDHDTTAGLAAARVAAAQCPHLQFLPGIEISAKYSGGTLHILGLGIDESSQQLAELTSQLRQDRHERNPLIIEKLQAVGIDITMTEVLAAAGRAPDNADDAQTIVSRVHIADVLRSKGAVKTIAQAFEQYLGTGGKAYVPKDHLPPRTAIDAIHAAGGVAMLAHPAQLNCDNFAQLQRVVRNFVNDGLDGLEVYHSSHSDLQTRAYLDLAKQLDLLICGGSDFHGFPKPDIALGRPKVSTTMISPSLLTMTEKG